MAFDKVVNLTTRQREERIQQAQIAALATDALADLAPDIVLATFEAHIVERDDITPEAIEAMSNRIRHVAWAKERGEL